jgi:dihydrolipoamide dehydrogenase
MGHLLALAVQHGLTAVDLLRMPFYHPTLEERLQDALRDIANKTAEQPPQPMDLEQIPEPAQQQAAE